MNSETILVVEDEPAILKMTQTMLEDVGYTIIACRTPKEAIELVTDHKEKIHMLLTDVVIPEMNGRELAGRIEAIFPGINTLFMSGYTANVIAHHGVLDEGVNFIQKPFAREDMMDKILEILTS